MEFFRIIEKPQFTVSKLHDLISIGRLSELCDSIDKVLSDRNSEGEIYCIWGQFNIRRDLLESGVRFSLLNCLHALAWTVTYDAEREVVTVHCTIDKQEHDADFVESIEQFVDDWRDGLQKAIA